MSSIWDKLNASTQGTWFQAISIGLGVLGLGFLIAFIGFLLTAH